MLTQEQFSALLPKLSESETDQVELTLARLRKAHEAPDHTVWCRVKRWLVLHYQWCQLAGLLWDLNRIKR